MWIPVGDPGEGRWTWTADDVVHLLLLHDGVLWELHRNWLHRYRPADPIPDQPIDDSEWIDSRLLPIPQPETEDEGWRVLADLVSTEGDS